METKPELTYTGVRVHSKNTVLVSSVADELAEEQVDHSIVFTWSPSGWTKKPIPHAVVAMCSLIDPAPQLFNVCATGEVIVASRAGFVDEHVDRSDDGPSHLTPLRSACAIQNTVYVAGMARRVYRRAAPGRWEAIDEGVFIPRNLRTASAGFLCLGGFGPSDIYAAGYKGEIWHYDGSKWTKQESPTNVALTSLRCGPDGLVYIAGLGGVLVRGRDGSWAAITQTVTADDFWGAAIFRGIAYFATDRAVYRLVEGELELVDFGPIGSITTRYLDCDSEVMWSVGSKHLIATQDASRWEEITGPN
jgi:hypothetical protein